MHLLPHMNVILEFICMWPVNLPGGARRKRQNTKWTRHVLTGQIPPQQQPLCHGWPRYRFRVCVHCDLDLGDMISGQGDDTPLSHGQEWCEILSRSNMAVRSYSWDTDFGYKCTVTLTLEVWHWHWVKVRHTLGSWTTIVWNITYIQYGSEELWPGHVSFGMCALWPWPWRYDLWRRSCHNPWVSDNNCVKYYPDPTWQGWVMAQTRIFGMCALWPWPWRYDLRSRSWHTLRSWTTIVWNII